MARVTKKLDAGSFQLKDQVVSINRVTKVVKGGKNMSFAALVVVGDPSAAVVGYGSGKAKEVPQAIRKGIESAKKNLIRVNLTQTSVPHTSLGRFGSGMVLLKPAPEGTGVIAGGAVRAVMTSAGVQNVLTKSIGTNNPHNVIKATFEALKKLKNREDVAALRRKVVATVDEAIDEASADVTAILKDGRREHVFVEHAIGSLERPMLDAALEEKFHALADPVIGAGRANRLIAACWQLGGSADVHAVIEAATPA